MKAWLSKANFICILFWMASAFLAISCGRNTNSYLEDALKIEAVDSKAPPEGLFPLPYFSEAQGQFNQKNGNEPIDILFSIDNSSSMYAFIDAVEQNVARFIEGLTGKSLDFQVGVVRCTQDQTNTYDSSLQGPHKIVRSSDLDVAGKVRANIRYVRNTYYNNTYEKNVSILLDAISNPANGSLFRRNAIPVFFVLTDAHDIDYYSFVPADVERNVQMFADRFNQFAPDGRWMMTSIGSPSWNPCPTAQDLHQPLLEALTIRSGGQMGRVCEQDYSKIMDEALMKVYALQTEFSVVHLIPLDKTITRISVAVNGQMVPQDAFLGFVYNPMKRTISFPGSYVPSKGTMVEVIIEYEEI